jgi:hypothetical protein
MKRLLIAGAMALPALLTGCMDPNSVDAQTHCLIPSMCLDIPGNHGNGPGFWGTVAASRPQYIAPPVAPAPPMQPVQHMQHVTCTKQGVFTDCDAW